MDNVTHSLLGVLLARAALPWVGSLRGALWAGIVASNAPDLDIFATPFFEDERVGYLVHHRGHTHTLIGVAALGLAAAAVGAWRDPAARRGPLVILGLVAALLHLGADGWNNYGIHPFWPWDSTWRYGDMVFILEPILWMALLPVAYAIASRRVRVGLGVVGLGMAGIVTVGLGPLAAVGFAGVTLALVLLQARRDRLDLPTGLVATALLAFGLGTRAAEDGLRARLAAQRPDERVLDVVLTPRAATPWCWQGIVLSRDTTSYHARDVLLSLAPALTAPEGCAIRTAEARTAPLVDADLTDDPTVTWGTRFEAPAAELGALVAEQCRVDAFLRFARAPFWVVEAERVVVGDLRFDFEAELGFAEVETKRATPADTRGCDDLPPWRSGPVTDLLALD